MVQVFRVTARQVVLFTELPVNALFRQVTRSEHVYVVHNHLKGPEKLPLKVLYIYPCCGSSCKLLVTRVRVQTAL